MMHRVVFFLLATLSGVPALAAVDLLPKLIEVQGKQVTRVTVVNRSDHPEFVTVSLSRLLNPGVPWQQERLEPAGISRSPSLYAFPFRLTLAVGQSKTITLQPLTAVQQETVWRLQVTPVTTFSASTPSARVAGVAVNLSFSALVRQLPEKQTRDLHCRYADGHMTLTATGTSRYAVKGLTVDGVKHKDFNVYPGTPVVITGHHASAGGKNLCR